MAAVVAAMNAAFPGADTVAFPDRGAKQEQKAAEIAMSVLGQSVPLPEALPERSDYNDFVSDRGIDAARQWIANTLRSTLRRVSFVQARAIGRVPIDEVLVGLPIGSIGMLVGQGAIGKTMLMMQVAAGLALGRDLTQMSNIGQSHFLSPVTSQPRRVALILGEDSHDLVHNRLVDLIEATGLDDRDVHQLDDNLRIYTQDGDDMRVVSLGRDRQMSEGPLLSGLARLGAWADLLVLDPLVRLSDADENDNTAASAVMLALSQLAKTRRTAIVVLHHVAKASGAKGEKGDWRWARGAAAYSTSSRWQVLLRPVEDEMGTVRHDVVRVEMVKHNYTRAQQPFGLVRGPHGVLRFDLHAQSSIAFAAPNGAVATPTAGVRARDLLKRGASSGYDDPFE
jgi:RecA-family ATPase